MPPADQERNKTYYGSSSNTYNVLTNCMITIRHYYFGMTMDQRVEQIIRSTKEDFEKSDIVLKFCKERGKTPALRYRMSVQRVISKLNKRGELKVIEQGSGSVGHTYRLAQ